MTLEQAIDLAIQHFEQCQFEQAEAICLAILRAVPRHAQVSQILGGIAFRRGDLANAERHFRDCTVIDPTAADYFDNLAMVLNARCDPATEAAARSALAIDPRHVSAWNHLGLALRQQRQFAAAESAFRSALAIAPAAVQVLNNLANLIRDRDRAAESEAICRAALQHRPDVAELWLGLGAALHDQHQYQAAVAAFDECLRLRPSLAQAAFNRGASLEAMFQLAQAARSYERAISVSPGLLTAWNNLGVVRKLQGQLEVGRRCFEHALQSKSDYMVAHTNLLATLQCDPEVAPEELLEAHREWDRRHAAPWSGSEHSRLHGDSTRPLRVGFVSPDFGNHPVGRFLIRAFEHLPKDIETFCYSDRPHADEITRRFRTASSRWRDTRLHSDEELAGLIRQDGIDVLIDLAGHTGQHRLLVFARRPAAVQATWIGYPGTTGLAAMDFIIADRVLIPDEQRAFYSEEVVWLDGPWVCVEPPAFADDVESSDSPCLSKGYATYGSFNKLDKTTPQVLRLWAEILQSVPNARLELRNSGLTDPETRQGIISVLEADGVDATRIECHGWSSHREIYNAYRGIDIALDTFPFSGGATSADALWMGVPVVTLAGDTLAGRQTMSMLLHSGVTETVTYSLDEYRDRAVSLAGDPLALNELRTRMRTAFRNGPLCDAIRAGDALGRWLKDAVNKRT